MVKEPVKHDILHSGKRSLGKVCRQANENMKTEFMNYTMLEFAQPKLDLLAIIIKHYTI